MENLEKKRALFYLNEMFSKFNNFHSFYLNLVIPSKFYAALSNKISMLMIVLAVAILSAWFGLSLCTLIFPDKEPPYLK